MNFITNLKNKVNVISGNIIDRSNGIDVNNK
jgi:hypothetical protein